jgi:hypothetical protein
MKATSAEPDIIDFDDLEPVIERDRSLAKHQRSQVQDQRSATLTYLVLPAIFLTVTLLGGLRLAAADNAFIFLKPALVCLVFAALAIVLYFRSGVVVVEGWFSHDLSGLKNTANACVLLTLFLATVQTFNSLLPEQGLPFWVVGFCFLWTLWNNLFAEFDTKRLLKSLFALFGMAFVVKYLLLANLTAPESGSWLRRVVENPGKEAFTWLLDLPRYAGGTGYIQFVTLALYMIGLYLTPRSTKE